MSTPRRKPAVVHEIDDETVLCNVDGGRLLVLNDVGAAVWHLVDGHRSIEDITALVIESLPAEAEQVRIDVAAFLDALAAHDLIEWKA